MLIYPPFACAAPDNIYSLAWGILIVSFVEAMGEGSICIMVESSTKQHPTSFRESWYMQHFNTAPYPASRRNSSSGVLMISHISGV